MFFNTNYSHLLKAEDVTNEQGEFHFSNLGRGRYNLRIYNANSKEIVITGGQNEPVKLMVSIPEWSELKPKKPELIKIKP